MGKLDIGSLTLSNNEQYIVDPVAERAGMPQPIQAWGGNPWVQPAPRGFAQTVGV